MTSASSPSPRCCRFARRNDAVINTCQDWLADNYRTPSPVAAMMAVSGLTERTFIRRFREATGMTPLDYVHALRLEEAKQMLETGDLQRRGHRQRGGLRGHELLRRLFRRKVGLTPRNTGCASARCGGRWGRAGGGRPA